MKNIVNLLVLATFVVIVSGITPKILESTGKEIKDKLLQNIKENTIFEDLKTNFYNYATLQYLKTSTSDLKICERLDNKEKIKNLDNVDLFYFYRWAHEASCSKIQLTQEKKKVILAAANSEELDTFYRENVVGFLYKFLDSTQIELVCEKVQDFLDATGAARLFRKKNSDTSFEATQKVLNIAYSCLEQLNQKTSTGLRSLLKKAISNIPINSLQLNKETRAIYDGLNPVTTTANIVYYVRRLSKHLEIDDFVSVFPEFLNFLSEASEGTLCSPTKYAIFRALSLFNDFPLVNLDQRPILSGKKSVITLQCNNIFGEPITKLPKITGQLSLNGKKIGNPVTFEKKNNQIQSDLLETNLLTELRFYDLELTVSDSSSLNYKVTKSLGITTKVSVQNFRFEVVQSKVAPKILSNEVAFNQVFREEVAANQNSFIHIQFELKFDDKKAVPIKQIAVRLKHPEYLFSTNLVSAVYDSNAHVYKTIIDLGDPDHVMAYNGVYKAELLVADELLQENIKWTFANYQISFQKPLKTAPLSDIDYLPMPLISHKFPSPNKSPPSFITLTFCLSILAVVVFFIGILKGINVNMSGIPDNVRGAFFSLLFVLVIIGYIGLLCLFWVKINLIDLLSILVVVFIPTILIGNEGLVSLNLEQEIGEAIAMVE